MLDWGQDVPLQTDTLQFLKFKPRYLKMKDKQRWNYFNQLFPFKFKSKADYQNNYQKYLSVAVLMNFCSDNFLKIISTTHLWQILF